MAVQEHPRRLAPRAGMQTGGMKRRIWLIVLVLYAAAGIADGAYHLMAPKYAADRSNVVVALPVAFSAGLFWPIDIVARPLLMR